MNLRRPLLWLTGVLLSSACLLGCSRDIVDSSVVVGLARFARPEIAGLPGIRLELHIDDAETGAPAQGQILNDNDEDIWVQSPLPMACDETGCDLNISLPSGTYLMELRVFAQDRCGTEGLVMRLSADGPVVVERRRNIDVILDVADYETPDDDGDDIWNIFELAVCGRFDLKTADAYPAHCAKPDDPCCATVPSPERIGDMTAFAGGTHILATGVAVAVEPFALDATEVTVGSYRRCVAAGVCLADAPDSPAWSRVLDTTRSPALPMTGVTPLQADTYCRWLSKRLPLDTEWDYMAAHRATLPRARLPFDAPADATLSCQPDPTGGLAANHRAHGVQCPREPLPVGSYPGTDVTRGDGPALADVAGNVFEWTVEAGAPVSATSTLLLRGGDHSTIPQFLEDAFSIRLDPESSRYEGDLQRLSDVAGFRCAASERIPRVEEPACPLRQ